MHLKFRLRKQVDYLTLTLMRNKVLIVDDETLLVNMYKAALLAGGYDVYSAQSGDEGLAKIKSLKPDLVLLDIMMPNMTGLEILDYMRADATLSGIPVVMLTNLTWTPDPNVALDKGALAVWLKATHKPQDLLSKVNSFFAARKGVN